MKKWASESAKGFRYLRTQQDELLKINRMFINPLLTCIQKDKPLNLLINVSIRLVIMVARHSPSGSTQLSISVEEVSLYFLGGDPMPYIGLVPIDPRSS